MPLALTHKIIATIVGGLFFIIVLRLIRRRRLAVSLSIWWMIAGLMIIVLAWSDRLLRSLASHIALELSSVLLIGGMMFLLFTCLHMSVSITKLSQQIRQICQVIALNNVKYPPDCAGPDSLNPKRTKDVKSSPVSAIQSKDSRPAEPGSTKAKNIHPQT